jgi:hypothetical protein
VGALLMGLAPRSAGYRCAVMGIVTSAPCCDQGAPREQTQRAAIDRACCDRVDGAGPAVTAADPPARARLAQPLAVAYTLPAATVLARAVILDAGVVRLRAGPPSDAERIPTVVLRV